MTARPFMKFYTTDWRGDPKLRMCSIGARGLWIEMLCIMHEAEPYGTLSVNRTVIPTIKLAALAGVSEADALIYLQELSDAGVFSRNGDVIYSRRMQRDHEKSIANSQNGKLGGNPTLKPSDNPPLKPPDKAEVKPHSQSPESRVRKKEKYTSSSNGSMVSDWSFESFWVGYPKKVGKLAAQRSFLKAHKRGEVSFETLMAAVGSIEASDPKFIPHPSKWLNDGRYLDGAPAPQSSTELSPEEQANRDYWLAELAKEKHAQGTELAKTSSVVDAKFGHREGSRELGAGPSWVPRIQRMGRAFQAGNGSNSAVHDDSNADQQGSDVTEPVAKSTGTA